MKHLRILGLIAVVAAVMSCAKENGEKSGVKHITLTAESGTPVNQPAEYIINPDMLAAVKTLRHISGGSLFSMKYEADYMLDASLVAGAKNAEEMNAFQDQNYKEGIPIPLADGVGMCSAFIAHTPDGDMLLARNYDYGTDHPCIVMTLPARSNRYANVSMIDTRFVSAWYGDGKMNDATTDVSRLAAAPWSVMDGINEYGVAFGVLQLSAVQFDNGKMSLDPRRQLDESLNPEKKDMTPVCQPHFVRTVLDKCKNVDEAEQWLRTHQMHNLTPFQILHLVVADPNGYKLFEWVDNKLSVLDDPIIENFYLTPGGPGVQNGDGTPYRHVRYNAEKAAWDACNGIMTEERAMEILREARYSTEHITDGEHTDVTNWSIVYNLTKKTAKFCRLEDYDTVYEYKFSDMLK